VQQIPPTLAFDKVTPMLGAQFLLVRFASQCEMVTPSSQGLISARVRIAVRGAPEGLGGG
jgi:hypothetical protein